MKKVLSYPTLIELGDLLRKHCHGDGVSCSYDEGFNDNTIVELGEGKWNINHVLALRQKLLGRTKTVGSRGKIAELERRIEKLEEAIAKMRSFVPRNS